MNKTYLEEKIREQAEEQTEQEYYDFLNLMNANEFAKKLKIKLNGEEITLFNFGCNYGLFNHEQQENKSNKYTNYDDVFNEILNDNIESKTESLLNKLEHISYLFDGNRHE